MPVDHEQRIAAAIAAVRNGQLQKTAAKTYGVSRATLSRRFQGGLSREQAHETDRLLSPEVEAQIVDWIHHSESAGRRPYRWEIVQFAECILKGQGRSHAFGSHWVHRFISRHPSAKMESQIAREAARPAADRPDKIKRVIDNQMDSEDENVVEGPHLIISQE
ncbi:hypothetical protein CHU98_g12162 [Xylaria longipes]|nr:hypothetical protein CHU98_g12162 [Xylaria longipes]